MADETKKETGEDLVAAGQAAAVKAEQEQIAQEQASFEKDLKEKLRENGKLMGLTFSPNEGIVSMRQKLADAREQLLQEPLVQDVTVPVDERKAELTFAKNCGWK